MIGWQIDDLLWTPEWEEMRLVSLVFVSMLELIYVTVNETMRELVKLQPWLFLQKVVLPFFISVPTPSKVITFSCRIFFSSVTNSCCVFVVCPCSSFWIHFRFMKAGFHFSFAQEILPTIFWFGVMSFDVVQHKAGVIVSFHIHSLYLGRIQALSVCVCVSFPAYTSI